MNSVAPTLCFTVTGKTFRQLFHRHDTTAGLEQRCENPSLAWGEVQRESQPGFQCGVTSEKKAAQAGNLTAKFHDLLITADVLQNSMFHVCSLLP
ncbi:hypothetical protein BES08_07150 [Novosphingobium resinovorum]|uniref:Uncharacterized protein n=1 Tax=Novosphingobium resinovorum TaxID=158500 RepID=A0A1D8A3A3_9SPHN|nr:hypothetical protein BES08_07150 [Novosphingobium resinovorum]